MTRSALVVISGIIGYAIGVVSLFIWAGHKLYEDFSEDR